jgi:hypothetical protein
VPVFDVVSGVADGLFNAILIGYVCPGDFGLGPEAPSLMMKLLMLLLLMIFVIFDAY